MTYKVQVSLRPQLAWVVWSDQSVCMASTQGAICLPYTCVIDSSDNNSIRINLPFNIGRV